MTTEIYPMPMFPTLVVQDAAASATWYQEVLGLHHVFTMPDPTSRPLLVHLRWAKYADLLLRQQPDPVDGERGQGVSLTFAYGPVDADLTIDEVTQRAGQDVRPPPA